MVKNTLTHNKIELHPISIERKHDTHTGVVLINWEKIVSFGPMSREMSFLYLTPKYDHYEMRSSETSPFGLP